MIIINKQYDSILNQSSCYITSNKFYKFKNIISYLYESNLDINIIINILQKIINYNKYYKLNNLDNLIKLSTDLENNIINKNNNNLFLNWSKLENTYYDSTLSINIKNKVIVKNITENTIEKIINKILKDKLNYINSEDLTIVRTPINRLHDITKLYINIDNNYLDKLILSALNYCIIFDLSKYIELEGIKITSSNEIIRNNDGIPSSRFYFIENQINYLLNISYIINNIKIKNDNTIQKI